MNRVSLVCTVHGEKGSAIATELAAVLDQLRPTVFFVEMPTARFDDYFTSCRTQNLESVAIRSYRAKTHAEIIPVDLPTPEDSLFRDDENAFDKVRRHSPECRELMEVHSARVRHYGLRYLNSDDCCRHWSDFYREALATGERIADPALVAHYKLWIQTNERRDKAMVQNILDYCEKHRCEEGVFLVGAAHRQSVMDKAKNAVSVSKPIQWNFQLPAP